MACEVQQSAQMSPPSTMGYLNTKALPEGILTVYLKDKLYRLTNQTEQGSTIACAIAFLKELKYEPETDLEKLIDERRMGAIHVEHGKIKSLTLAPEQIEMLRENNVTEIAFMVDQTLLKIKDAMLLREFSSDEEYQNYSKLIKV